MQKQFFKEILTGYTNELHEIIAEFNKAQEFVLEQVSPMQISKAAIRMNGFRQRLGQIVAGLGRIHQEARHTRKQAFASQFSFYKIKDPETGKLVTDKKAEAQADIATTEEHQVEITCEELFEKCKALREDIQEQLFLFISHSSNINRENERTGNPT